MTDTPGFHGEIADPERTRVLLAALDDYRLARQAILAVLGLAPSNRDPLAEFSEHLVTALIGGTLAANRVQRDYDLTLPDHATVQVRYLANPTRRWVNEHRVHAITGVAWYALVLFEAFTVAGVLVFPTTGLAPICGKLGKRHPAQDQQIQFTRRNWLAIRDDPAAYRALGMRIWLPAPTGPASL
jgi:hypothetical protein